MGTEETAKRPLKVCVVGAGMIAQDFHLPAVVGSDALELVAIVDASEAVGRDVANALGTHFSSCIEDAPSADLCLVATPAHVRRQVVLPALSRGMHVLCEKPFALSLLEAEEMIYAANSYGKKAFVGHTRRFFPNLIMVRELLKGGLFESPVSIRIVEGGMYSWRAAASDRGRKRSGDLGVLHDEGSHIMDLLTFLLGAVDVTLPDMEVGDSWLDRDLSANNFLGTGRWKSADAKGEFSVKLSRSMNLQTRLVVSDRRLSVSTRSLFDTEIRFRLQNQPSLQIPVQDRFPGIQNLKSCFAAIWDAVVGTISQPMDAERPPLVKAESALSGIELIERFGSKKQIMDFDPYSVEWIDEDDN